MENPFAGLRPEMRSEHDEIRKGIFSRALRNMQFAPLSERREWCKAIRATYSAAQAARQKRAGAAPSTASSCSTLKDAQPSPSSSPSSPSAGTKRSHSSIEDDSPSEPSGQSTNATTTAAAPPESTGASTVEASHPASPAVVSAANAACDPREKQASAAVAAEAVDEGEAEEESEESVKECIAAYLRSLLDRVVGVSLENLNVPALRILCTMVGIRTEVRNKIGLYSTLATFYYTECEKLGKRVSRDTILVRQAEQEAAMLRQVLPPTASKKNAEKRGDGSGGEVARANATTTSTSGGGKSAPAAVVVSVTSERAGDTAAPKAEKARKAKMPNAPIPAKLRAATTTAASSSSASGGGGGGGGASGVGSARRAAKAEVGDVDHYLKYEHYEVEELESDTYGDALVGGYAGTRPYETVKEDPDEQVVYGGRVFSRTTAASSSASAATGSHMAKYSSTAKGKGNGDDDDDAWSTLMLERKVASIVQLHDPVTVAIVVKKLAQLGYRDAQAEGTVEHILRRFHDRQLIFYDNGIAYLM